MTSERFHIAELHYWIPTEINFVPGYFCPSTQFNRDSIPKSFHIYELRMKKNEMRYYKARVKYDKVFFFGTFITKGYLPIDVQEIGYGHVEHFDDWDNSLEEKAKYAICFKKVLKREGVRHSDVFNELHVDMSKRLYQPRECDWVKAKFECKYGPGYSDVREIHGYLAPCTFVDPWHYDSEYCLKFIASYVDKTGKLLGTFVTKEGLTMLEVQNIEHVDVSNHSFVYSTTGVGDFISFDQVMDELFTMDELLMMGRFMKTTNKEELSQNRENVLQIACRAEWFPMTIRKVDGFFCKRPIIEDSIPESLNMYGIGFCKENPSVMYYKPGCVDKDDFFGTFITNSYLPLAENSSDGMSTCLDLSECVTKSWKDLNYINLDEVLWRVHVTVFNEMYRHDQTPYMIYEENDWKAACFGDIHGYISNGIRIDPTSKPNNSHLIEVYREDKGLYHIFGTFLTFEDITPEQMEDIRFMKLPVRIENDLISFDMILLYESSRALKANEEYEGEDKK